MVTIELLAFNLADKEYKEVSIVLASALTKEIKPIFSLDKRFNVYEIKDRKKRYFMLIDEINSRAFIIRDDSEDFMFALAMIKARLIFTFNLICGNEKDFRFAYDNDAFYLIAKDEKTKPKAVTTPRPTLIKIPLKGKTFYLPIKYTTEYKRYIDVVSVKGFAIIIYYKDFSRLLRDIVSSLYTLKAG